MLRQCLACFDVLGLLYSIKKGLEKKLFCFLLCVIVSCELHLGEFPYAKCFICGEIGHLSRSCPDNPRGLYPKGNKGLNM